MEQSDVALLNHTEQIFVFKFDFKTKAPFIFRLKMAEK